MAVDNQKLVSQTFKLVENLNKSSKDELASRARLLALALQQAERAFNEMEVRNEVLCEAMETALAATEGKRAKKKTKGEQISDVTKILKKALSPYADDAYARAVIKAKKSGKKVGSKKDKKAKKSKK